MKKYNITLNYHKPERDSYGFPQFGETVVEILSINQPNIYPKLDQLFGKDNYNIIDIIEEIVDTKS